MNRRHFLQLSSQVGMLSLLNQLAIPGARANDTATKIKNLIYVHFNAGWDVTLGLDPQVNNLKLGERELFLGYRPEEIVKAESLLLGPAAAALKAHAKNCVVVNGVSMLGNVSHEDCTRWAQTGVVERSTPGMPAMVARIGRSEFESSGAVSEGGTLETMGIQVASIPSSQITGQALSSIEAGEFIEPDSELAKAIQDLNHYSGAMKELYQGDTKIQSLIQGNQQLFPAFALAFKSGYTRAGHWHINDTIDNASLDTHGSHKRNHPKVLTAYFAKVLELVEFLKGVEGTIPGQSLYDETLIVVSSDFSRETNLNGGSVETSGKEHNGYTNSYLLMSGSMQGGYSIGESVIQQNRLNRPTIHMARNFDFAGGRAIRNRDQAAEFMANPKAIKQIRPGHVVRTVAALLGAEDQLQPNLAALPKLPVRA